MEVLLLILFVVYLIANITILVVGVDLGIDISYDGWKETITYKHIIEFILFPMFFIEVSLIYLFINEDTLLNKKVFKKKDKKYIDK